jgi:hypothetical protein
MYHIFTCISEYGGGFGLLNRFIVHLQIVTTNNCNTIADFNITNHSTLSHLSLLSLVFTRYQLSTMDIPLQCLHYNFFSDNESWQRRFFRFRCSLSNTTHVIPQLH